MRNGPECVNVLRQPLHGFSSEMDCATDSSIRGANSLALVVQFLMFVDCLDMFADVVRFELQGVRRCMD